MNNPLQHKLFHFEAPPPEGVWEKIALSLEENFPGTVSEKLYQFEETPPPPVWESIRAQLDHSGDQKAKVVPFLVRHRRALKYSGAVAIFIVVAMITSLLISKKSESELPARDFAARTAPVRTDTAKTPSVSKEQNYGPERPSGHGTEQPLAQSRVMRIHQEEKEKLSAENYLPRQAERNDGMLFSSSSDKYMMYSDEEGNAIRLPKKLFNAFACPTNNTDCKERLQKLREKFAASAVTPDFTGLLEILKSLQENQ